LATTPASVPKLNAVQVLDSVDARCRFHYLSAKLDVNYSTANETKSFGVRARLKQDSIIWLSITPAMGIEVVRLVITPDSILMVNRLDQKYFAGSADKANQLLKLDVSFDVLQSVLTGSFTHLYPKAEYVVSDLLGLYLLEASPKDRSDTSSLQQRTEVDPTIWRVTRSLMRHPFRNEQILAEYNGFQRVDKLVFPATMRFRVQAKENIAVDIAWSKIEEKSSLNFPFNIPDKYVPY
jgi:hypothetical protein